MSKEEYEKLSIAELQDHITTLQLVLTKKLQEGAERHFYVDIPFLMIDQPSPINGRIYTDGNDLREAIDKFNRDPQPVTLETDSYMRELTQQPTNDFKRIRSEHICGSVIDLKLTPFEAGQAIVGTLCVHGPKHAEAMALIGRDVPKPAMRALTRSNVDGTLSIVELVSWDLVDYRKDNENEPGPEIS